jgi:nucleoside-diphosphate-sugar epimerase
MPTVVIKPGATVLVTGVNGLIGSYVVDQLLVRGYNVRGAVRSVERTKWLKEYFDDKYKDATVALELVQVPDMMIEGCYDGFLDGKTSPSTKIEWKKIMT